jgi:hypothetical protein
MWCDRLTAAQIIAASPEDIFSALLKVVGSEDPKWLDYERPR